MVDASQNVPEMAHHGPLTAALLLRMAGPTLAQIAAQQAQLLAQVNGRVDGPGLHFSGLAMSWAWGRDLAQELLLNIMRMFLVKNAENSGKFADHVSPLSFHKRVHELHVGLFAAKPGEVGQCLKGFGNQGQIACRLARGIFADQPEQGGRQNGRAQEAQED
jgi:hypothetical protein